MKLWRFKIPRDDQFARASRVGTWEQQGDPPRSVRVPPMVIEWEPSSTAVGDFTWAGPGEYLVKKSVAEEIRDAGFGGFEMGVVEMRPNRDHKRPKRNMISLPYDGPEVVELMVTKWVPLDMEHSTVKVARYEDGKPVYALEGMETTKTVDWNRETGELEKIHIPRTPGMGAYVRKSELNDCSFFKMIELPVGFLCTDRARDFILDKCYTNIGFSEAGEVIE